MRIDRDAATVLADGFRRIREEHDVPDAFPPEVVAAADEAGRQPLPPDRDDARALPFVTLDPAGSTDLDQAMALAADDEGDGDALVLSYAIADVGAFVAPGDVVDDEAWRRGVTVYAPDGPARLYPPSLSERAASLLPDGDRPAVLLTVVVDRDGRATLRSARRALVRSRAQLAYGPGPIAGLPPLLPELARRIEAADEARRGLAPRCARAGDREGPDHAHRGRAPPPAAGSQRGRERGRQPRREPGRGGHDGCGPLRSVPNDAGAGRSPHRRAASHRGGDGRRLAEGAEPADLRPVARSAGPEPGRVPLRGPPGRRGRGLRDLVGRPPAVARRAGRLLRPRHRAACAGWPIAPCSTSCWR